MIDLEKDQEVATKPKESNDIEDGAAAGLVRGTNGTAS